MEMADTDNVAIPEEVEETKTTKAEVQPEAGDSNSVEEPLPTITMRNVVQVPSNCPAGTQMGADGVCREVF